MRNGLINAISTTDKLSWGESWCKYGNNAFFTLDKFYFSMFCECGISNEDYNTTFESDPTRENVLLLYFLASS